MVSAHPKGVPEASNFPRRILVVDDNTACAKTLGWTMELFGHEVRFAHNGQEALRVAGEFLPDIVFLDIGLPDMTGYDVCRMMRSDDRLRNTVLVAQTGWGQEQHRQQSQEAGFDIHLVKPVSIDTLQKLVSDLVEPVR